MPTPSRRRSVGQAKAQPRARSWLRAEHRHEGRQRKNEADRDRVGYCRVIKPEPRRAQVDEPLRRDSAGRDAQDVAEQEVLPGVPNGS